MEKPRNAGRTFMVWLALVFGAFMVWQFAGQSKERQEVPYSAFMAEVEGGKVTLVGIRESDRKLVGTRTAGDVIVSHYTGDENIAELLRGKKVVVTVVPPSNDSGASLIIGLLPTILLVLVMFLLFRRMSSQMGSAQKFASSKAKRVDERKVTTRFSDVLGADEAVDETRDLVAFFKDPRSFAATGARIPKGVLMIGPPGTGKTLLARAIAGEAGVPFFSITGSDFVEMFVGVGASRVRDLFGEAKKHAPCIVFIDEIDSVGRHRGGGLGTGHDEREQTLNQLLAEMDGFDSAGGMILIAATNRPDVLDPALLRSGRFDRHIVMPRPDVRGRRAILNRYLPEGVLEAGTPLEPIAASSAGFVGADLEKLANEAKILASKAGRDKVSLHDLDRAFEKIVLGPERPSLVLREKDKRRVCRHEAGHSLTVLLCTEGKALHKVTVIPRGMALGVTWSLPEGDMLLRSESELCEETYVLLGGRVAEKLCYDGDVSTGARDDLEKATENERAMVAVYGMDKDLGPMSYAPASGPVFLGRDLVEKKPYAEETAREIDLAVRERLKRRESYVEQTLSAKRRHLEVLADALYERETLSRAEIDAVLAAADAAEKA